jgi:hypothetical protein
MKLKISFGVIVLLISALSTFAQSGGNPDPCGPNDNDGTCPLDTWVIVLVAAISVFAAFRLYRRKKISIQTIR